MDKQKTAGIGHDWRTEHPPSAPRIEEWGSAPAPRPSIKISQAQAEAQDAACGWTIAPRESLNSGWVVAPPTNAHTKPQVMRKRPFDRVADGHGVDIAAQIPVTKEMYDAGCAFLAAEGISGDRITSEYILDNIYPAMAVVAPPSYRDDLADAYCALEVRLGDELRRNADLEATNTLALSEIAELEADHFRLVAALNDSHKRVAELLVALARFKVAAEEAGNHDYNGPTQDGKAVPDPAHERFHGAIGDVLAGKIIPAARRQMQEALKSVPKEQATIRPLTNTGDPRRIGWV